MQAMRSQLTMGSALILASAIFRLAGFTEPRLTGADAVSGGPAAVYVGESTEFKPASHIFVGNVLK